MNWGKAVLLVGTTGWVMGQSGAPARSGDPHPCKVKLVSTGDVPGKIAAAKGEKGIKAAPIVTFEILESGEVVNARIQRSSGMADLDRKALSWIRAARYNSRPGCGVIESTTSVIVHPR